jgi:hypothetical protein
MANLVTHLTVRLISTRFRIRPATVRAVQLWEPTGINLSAGARQAAVKSAIASVTRPPPASRSSFQERRCGGQSFHGGWDCVASYVCDFCNDAKLFSPCHSMRRICCSHVAALQQERGDHEVSCHQEIRHCFRSQDEHQSRRSILEVTQGNCRIEASEAIRFACRYRFRAPYRKSIVGDSAIRA